MRVAMTGGGGFLGSHLLARLIGAGSLVTLVGPDLGTSRYTASMVAAGRARFVRCDADFTDRVAARSIADASALVLMDSLPQPSASRPERLVDEVEASLAPLVPLLCAFASRGGHVVFASSGAVYGDPVRTPSRESDLPRPRSTFAIARLACEHALRLCSARATVSVLRYGTVYGPGESPSHVIPTMIRAALAGDAPEVEGDGSDEHDYVHIADAVDATMSALVRRADGVYNVGTGIGTTMIELASLIVWLTGGKAAPLKRPADGNPARASLILDTSRARSDLAFAPRHALADGLKEEVGWLKATSEGNLKSAA